jgi:outer membrane lipopolysaccharide assembly protein LptE/RlpB
VRTLLLAVGVSAGLLSAGCGYSLRGHLPEHLQTVSVPVLQNRTQVPAVENFMTTALLNAFTTNGRLRVTTVERADAILEGEVVGYTLQAISYDATANVRQFRLTLTLNLRFRDVRQNKVLLQRSGYSDRADFAVVGTVADTIVASENAIQQAAAEIARSVVSFVVEQF